MEIAVDVKAEEDDRGIIIWPSRYCTVSSTTLFRAVKELGIGLSSFRGQFSRGEEALWEEETGSILWTEMDCRALNEEIRNWFEMTPS